MKLTNIFNNTCTQPNATSSLWPSCSQNPKTLSFRSIRYDEGGFKSDRRVSNISYNNEYSLDHPPTCSKMVSMEDLLEDIDQGVERVIRSGLKLSDRLFFEPGSETNSILGDHVKKTSNSNSVTLKSIESLDPYLDFKKSMEEMVDANNGVKSWDWLQELLGCYLKVNEKRHHEFIIGAFMDLLLGLDLVDLELINCSSFVASSSSPMRFSSSDISFSFTSNSTSNLPTDHEVSCTS